MRTFHSISHGLKRAFGDPKLLLLLWLINSLAALPGALAVGDAIQHDLGASAFHQGLDQGFDMDWMAEYNARHESGFPSLFDPVRSGAGVVYENLDAWFGGRVLGQNPALAVLLVAFGLAWTLLQGGLIARLAKPKTRFSARTFFGDAGGYFVRFLLLAAMAGVVYWLLYRLAAWNFGHLDEAFTKAGTERSLLFDVLAMGAIFVLLLHAVRMVFDYAKIAVVQDGSRLVPAALWQGLRFVFRRPLRTICVYAGVGVLSLAFLWLYTRLAPGAGQSTTAGVAFAFVVSQIFVAGRIFLRITLLGAEVEVYRDTGGM